MSVIFGILKEQGSLTTELEITHLASATERYATGRGKVYASGRLGMGYQPYISNQRSAMNTSPIVDGLGHVLSFDGRLDNYKELAQLLDLSVATASDSQIALAAFALWDKECFSHFVGDWALALWSEKDQSLYLARDHAGTRTLYFEHEHGRVLWSTQLDTFRSDGSETHFALDYVARYLASSPIRDLTPYEGVRSVPPAHCLIVRKNSLCRHSHWSSVVCNTIRYKTDSEYEEHFLTLFGQSIERRTGPGEPILAQLSGGMDSTAIVCMSDYLRRSADPNAEILDTVSFYDESEVSLNERTYFSITEANRGKVGIHIDTAFSQRTFEPHDSGDIPYLLPGADSSSIGQEHRFQDAIWSKGYRSILSGIGGDEVLGGYPTALPELANHLVSGNISCLWRQSVAWSLIDRSTLLGTLYDTTKYVIGLYAHSEPQGHTNPPWVSGHLRRRFGEIWYGSSDFWSRIGVASHRLDNSLAWWSVMETLPHLFPQILFRPEYRYPFLDKDLVNYLFSIPRDQVLRPGRRRSLMRRALMNIVPREILERRRKAFQLRAPLRAFQQAQPVLERLFTDSLLASAGFIDIGELRIALESLSKGNSQWWQALLRTVDLELWLRTMHRQSDRVSPAMDAGMQSFSSAAQQRSSGSVC